MTPSFVDLINLADQRLGAAVVAANDEFFAEKERLIDRTPPVWVDDRYTDRGKWMDGWETRRRREPGHDWVVVRLGGSATVVGVDVETTHFKGNYPESCALDVVDDRFLTREWDTAAWREVLPRRPLNGDAHNYFAVAARPTATHVRLRIFPDGGIARLRLFGEVTPDWASLSERGEVDLAAAQHGGFVVVCSDMFFGHRQHLIMPGDAVRMSDGWETRRRRDDGHDWSIIRLGHRGQINRVEVDTRHFKGNAPGACSLEATTDTTADPQDPHIEWRRLTGRLPLQPDAIHVFDRRELESVDNITHVRFNIFPDGGVARLRLFGRPA
jgi:allantoicase